MPKISLNHSDAIELAELLTFLADWLSGTRTHTLADSVTTFVGHSAYSWTSCAPTCTDSCSYSASATAKNSLETPHHDQRNPPHTTHT
jgi:hypothetical protein